MSAAEVSFERPARVTALVAAIVCAAASLLASPPRASAETQAQRIDALLRNVVRNDGVHAALVQAQIGRRIVIRKAYGQSMTGVLASVKMHYRNGNMAAAYVSALLLRLVEKGKVKLSDPLTKYRPELRDYPRPGDGDRVTLEMLAGMTAGYHDYVRDARLGDSIYGTPFDPVSTHTRLGLAFSQPLMFPPGTNFSYSHSNYVLLGLALERATNKPLEVSIHREVLKPLGLKNTRNSDTAAIPEPVLHTYSSERREFLGIPAGQRFFEETTFWNPQWTFPRGAIQTTNIADMTRSIIGIGTGKILKRSSFLKQVAPNLGFGRPIGPACEGCRTLDRNLGYGLGVFRYGSWVAAQPLFGGLGSVAAYLPGRRVAITIVTAMGERNFDETGSVNNFSRPLFVEIGKILAPHDPPPG